MCNTNEIETNATHVEELLSSKGPLPLRALADLTNYGESLLLAVLGWLSNQQKIRFFNTRGVPYAELNPA